MSFCFLSWVPVVVWLSPFWNFILFLLCFCICLFASSLHVLVRLSVSYFLFYFDSLVYPVLSFTCPVLPDLLQLCSLVFPISLVTCCGFIFGVSLCFLSRPPPHGCVFSLSSTHWLFLQVSSLFSIFLAFVFNGLLAIKLWFYQVLCPKSCIGINFLPSTLLNRGNSS